MIQIISSASLLSYSAILFGLICVTTGHSLIYLPGPEVGQMRDILHRQELPLQQAIDSNQLDDQPSLMRLLSSQSASAVAAAAAPAPPSSSNRSPQLQAAASSEHTRRILDDKLGILRESIFTTNNHLGHKGVPKSGSDEVF